MKLRVVLVLALLSNVLAMRGQDRSTNKTEDEVRAVIVRELAGWAKFDPVQVASCYTEDPTWQNPFGVRIHSRAILQKFLANLFQRPGYRSSSDTVAPHITDIHVLSPVSAVV